MQHIEQAHGFRYQLSVAGHRGTRAIQQLVEFAPASGGLALWMQHRDVDQAPEAACFQITDKKRFAERWVVGNDGSTLFYGPAFSDYSLEEQTGMVAHQVLHVALRHVDREAQLRHRDHDIDAELFAVCADAIVNSSLSHLAWLQLPKGSVMLDQLLLQVLGIEQSVDISLHQWSTETLYRAIDDRTTSGSSSSSSSSSSISDQHAGDSGKEAEHASNQRSASTAHSDSQSSSAENAKQLQHSQQTPQDHNDGPKAHAARQLAATIIRDLIPSASSSPETRTEQSMQWQERLLRAHAADQDQSFMRQLLADNNHGRTPWEQILRTTVQRALSLQTELNWSRPTRSWLANRGKTSTGKRLPWQPGTSYSRHSPRLCIMVDVSGSVDNKLMQRFANELDRIIRTFKAECLLIAGDDTVREQHRLKPGVEQLRELNLQGGGGTDFVPLIEQASTFKPDIGLFLTDLDGPAGEPPAWPIVWAVPASAIAMPIPYGRRIILDF